MSAPLSRSERQARDLLTAELMPNETIVWSGRPQSSGVIQYFARSWTRVWVWSVILVAWPLWSMTQDHENAGSPLTGWLTTIAARLAVVAALILVLVMGVAAALTVVGRLAFRTLYAVTDQRLVVVRQGWGGSTKWIGRSEVKRIRVRPQFGNRATLVFERDMTEADRLTLGDLNEEDPKARWRIEGRTNLAFIDLPDADAIRTLVERTFALQRD